MKQKYEYNISNSMLNAFRDVVNGESCFRMFFEYYVSKTAKQKTSAAMHLGTWFEYMVTGVLNRDGSIPQPMLIKSGELAADYKNASALIQAAKDTCVAEGNEYGVTLTHNLSGRIIKGVFDVQNRKAGIIRDIKLSANIDDKWHTTGWALDKMKPEILLNSKARHQSKMYCYLWFKNYGFVPDFYFDVFDSKGKDAVTWQVCYKQEDIEAYEEELLSTIKAMEAWINDGPDNTMPSISMCNGCNVSGCLDFATKPIVKTITLS